MVFFCYWHYPRKSTISLILFIINFCYNVSIIFLFAFQINYCLTYSNRTRGVSYTIYWICSPIASIIFSHIIGWLCCPTYTHLQPTRKQIRRSYSFGMYYKMYTMNYTILLYYALNPCASFRYDSKLAYSLISTCHHIVRSRQLTW